MSNLTKDLAKIQQELKAPKGQYNSFGKYSYRSCEDILEAVKPLLGGLTLTINDELVNLGERYYIKSTCTISNGEQSVVNSAFAREEENKKGMDGAQITGSASSYARKYALNGLFLIDDTRDADATNKHGKEEAPTKPKVAAKVKREVKPVEAKQSKTSFNRKKKTEDVQSNADGF